MHDFDWSGRIQVTCAQALNLIVNVFLVECLCELLNHDLLKVLNGHESAIQ